MDQRSTLLTQIRGEILTNSNTAITFVAIDGIDGAGKTTFADELAEEFDPATVIRSSVDGFHNPKSVRYLKGKDSPEGFFLDSYNYAMLKELLLNPLKRNPPKAYSVNFFDHRKDQSVVPESRTPPNRGILIFDGIFLHRPELQDYWDYSIFLEVSTREALRRCMARERTIGVSSDPEDPFHHRYVQGQNIYLCSCKPQSVCTRVINNDSFDAPAIIS